VRRTYDSIDLAKHEFGAGWRLDYGGLKIGSNGPLGDGGWSAVPVSCFIGLCSYKYVDATVHAVTITYPDGTQEIFDFTPTAGFGPFYFLGDSAFTARANTGTTSTLQVDGDTSLTFGFDGTLRAGLGGGVYNPTRFLLTTQDKRVLKLDVTAGLISETDADGNSFTIDSQGIHASNGASFDFLHDGAGRISSITVPGGAQITYAYSQAGDLTSVTYPNGTQTLHTYDGQHLLLNTTGNGNLAFGKQQYDASGRLVAVTDGAGNTTQITNDVAGRKQTFTSPSGRLVTIETLDDRGSVIRRDRIGDGHTVTETYTYDTLGRQLSYTDGGGSKYSFTYDAAGHVLTETDPQGGVTTYTYSPEGKPLTQIARDGTVVSSLTYDAKGHVIAQARADGSASHYAYDNQGHLAQSTDPGGHTRSFSYDAAGHLAAITDPIGRVSTVTMDAGGFITQLTDPHGNSTGLTYDGTGNIVAIADANANVLTFTYDARGNILSFTDAFGVTATQSYNTSGRLASYTNRAGQTVSYAYDVDGKLITRTLPGNNVYSFVYDAFGQLIRQPTAPPP